jgi:hypothetical protein
MLHVAKSAPRKLSFLIAEAASRGGKLTSMDAVAKAIKKTPGYLSQLFGAGDPGAETSINPKTLGAIVQAFQGEGLHLNVAMFLLSDEEFTEAVSAQASLAKSRPTMTADKLDGEPTLPSVEWLPDQPVAYTPLVAAQIHPPRPINSRVGCYYLDVSLRFESASYFLENETVTVGLSSAGLSFVSPAYQIAHMSLLGDAARPLVGVRASTTGIVIAALPEEQWLSGNPLGEYHFAVIEPAGDGPPSVSISVYAEPRHFVFALNSTETDAIARPPSPTKQAILTLVYRDGIEAHRDSPTGRMMLARATMRKRVTA